MAFTGPKRQKREQAAQRQQAPQGNGGDAKQQRRPWLKAEHMPNMNGVELDVQIGDEIRLYTGGDFGQQIIVAVTDENNREFDWSIKIGGQQFLRIEKRLGKNILGWPGKVIPVTRGDYNGKDYVEVVEQ